MAKLTEEQKQAIDNYGKEIRTLKDHITAIRTKPGMYIGHTGYKGFLNMMREIFQNSIDQILSPKSPANWFSFYYNENTLEVRVEDNGMSLPYDDIARIFTKAHTSKNFEKELYDYSSGTHGEGGKAVNALSLVYRIEAYHYDGTAVMMEFEQGYPKTKAPVKIPNKEKKQGLVTYFIPDQEIMGENCRLDWKTVYNLIKRIMSLTPIGSRCDFTAVSHKGKEFNETIINKDGIITDLIMKVSNPINKPIIFGADDGTRKVDIAFCYEAPSETGESDKESITSFANFCPTLGGSHVDSSMDTICRWFVSYMNNIYLANQKAKDKVKIVSADIKSGLNIFISAAHLYPVLVGQSKELLSNEDMIPFCKDVVNKGLDDWSKSNPQDLAKLCKYFKDMAEIRLKQEGAKAKIATKYSVNPITKYPRKYKKPINKTGIELIIVEGDSALGKAETDRDPYIQGLFPIRGKIINAFKASKQAFFSNEEVQGITMICFGQEYRKGLTIDDLKVDKIIIMADADVDGSHIAALLLRMFVMYFPFVIEAGRLYKAIPPLYSIKEGKKRRYFTEIFDYIKYNQKLFLDQFDFKDMKKNNISPKDVTKFFMKNNDYVYYLEKLSNTYSVDPYLMEMVLMHYLSNKKTIKVDKLKKEIQSIYRFMSVETNNGIPIIKGTIDKSNLIIFNETFLSYCSDVINILESNDSLFYLINNKKCSLYGVMKAYESVIPPNRQRYKGLGEMNGTDLGESTLRPDGDRVLVRYTLEDAKETLNLIREYESDTKKILKHVENVSREDLLD